jgi:PAS domain S-box-containing protein
MSREQWTAFGLALAILIAIALGTYRSLTGFAESSKWVNHTYAVLGDLERLVSELSEAESSARAYVGTSEESFLESYWDASSKVSATLMDLRQLTANPTQQERLSTLEPLVKQRLVAWAALIAARREKGLNAAAMLVDQGRQPMDAILGLTDALADGERKLLAERNRTEMAASRRTIVWLIAGNTLSFALLLSVYYFLRREIAQREQTGKELSRLASIVESSDDAILSKTLDGIVLSWNSGGEQLYGYPASEVIGRSLSFLRLPDWPDELPHILERIRKGERIERFETVRVRKDGQRINVSLSISPVRNYQGEVVGASEIARDVTQQKKAEEQIRELNAALEGRVAELNSANKEMESFAYSVSHDLRAPLRHIDGFSRILEEECGAQLDASAQRYLQRIRNGTRQMGNLVDDLLSLSHVSRKEIRRQATGLNFLVEEVRAELREAAAQRGVKRNVDWRIARLPFVDCDPVLIKQVFANLLSNAVKYSRPREHAVIEVGVISQNGETVLFVRDNGVGFSMKYADKLFGVFQRLHRQEDFEGTGVGLATVQRIVQKHGGRIWAEAELDRGACFYFTLGSASDAGSEVPATMSATTGGKA